MMRGVVEAWAEVEGQDLLSEGHSRMDTGVAFEDLVDITQIYLKDIGSCKLLSAANEQALALRMAEGDSNAQALLVKHNLRLVVSIAKHYLNRGLPLLDLIEEGNMGLMHAVEKFDVSRGFRLSTYATCWIRQNIERAIMNQSRTVRLPVHVVKELNACLRAARELESRSGIEPSMEEIAWHLGKPVADVRRLMEQNPRMMSLDAPLDRDPSLSVGEAIADTEQAEPDEALNNAELMSYLQEWLALLPSKQRLVVEHRYGLNGNEISTLEEVARMLGLARERVRQIQIESLAHLKQIASMQGIEADTVLA
ncbi:RNA polymerase sigma factor RpoS [Aquitalea sp. S1-19]|nr:RNA polymerase sigma factor RpoS [Aquitalea sp. S1-19]